MVHGAGGQWGYERGNLVTRSRTGEGRHVVVLGLVDDLYEGKPGDFEALATVGVRWLTKPLLR